jgi:hypothetical protein
VEFVVCNVDAPFILLPAIMRRAASRSDFQDDYAIGFSAVC